MAEPNSTLYLKNLNQKIKKDETKKSLFQLFSQYGAVIEVVHQRNEKMRGQAFIIYKDLIPAQNAKQSLTNFYLFDKPLVIEYAKNKSDLISKMEGTWVPKEKRAAVQLMEKQKEEQEKKEQAAAAENKNVKKAKIEETPVEKEEEPKSRFLKCTNLGNKANETILVMVFQAFAGYKSAKLLKEGGDAFGKIEFDTPDNACLARDSLQGFKITPSNLMVVEYLEENKD